MTEGNSSAILLIVTITLYYFGTKFYEIVEMNYWADLAKHYIDMTEEEEKNMKPFVKVLEDKYEELYGDTEAYLQEEIMGRIIRGRTSLTFQYLPELDKGEDVERLLDMLEEKGYEVWYLSNDKYKVEWGV